MGEKGKWKEKKFRGEKCVAFQRLDGLEFRMHWRKLAPIRIEILGD